MKIPKLAWDEKLSYALSIARYCECETRKQSVSKVVCTGHDAVDGKSLSAERYAAFTSMVLGGAAFGSVTSRTPLTRCAETLSELMLLGMSMRRYNSLAVTSL